MVARPGPFRLRRKRFGWASMAEIPLSICNIPCAGAKSTGGRPTFGQSDLHQAIFGSPATGPRVVLAPQAWERCFYIGDSKRTDRSENTSTRVYFKRTKSLPRASRRSTANGPVEEFMVRSDPPDAATDTYKPYIRFDQITQHVAPGQRILDGKYRCYPGLEHDEWVTPKPAARSSPWAI